MLNNETLRATIREAATALTKLDRELGRMEELEPSPLAGGLVEFEKLGARVSKLSTKLLAVAEVKAGKEKKGDQRRMPFDDNDQGGATDAE